MGSWKKSLGTLLYTHLVSDEFLNLKKNKWEASFDSIFSPWHSDRIIEWLFLYLAHHLFYCNILITRPWKQIQRVEIAWDGDRNICLMTSHPADWQYTSVVKKETSVLVPCMDFVTKICQLTPGSFGRWDPGMWGSVTIVSLCRSLQPPCA